MAHFASSTVVYTDDGDAIWFTAGEPVPDWVAKKAGELNPAIFATPPVAEPEPKATDKGEEEPKPEDEPEDEGKGKKPARKRSTRKPASK